MGLFLLCITPKYISKEKKLIVLLSTYKQREYGTMREAGRPRMYSTLQSFHLKVEKKEAQKRENGMENLTTEWETKFKKY